MRASLLYYIYRVSHEECARLREGVPYVKVYQYNPKHLCPKLKGYGDNGQRKVWSSGGSTHCTCQLTVLILLYRMSQEECARLREGVPYVKVYRYNPKHLCPKLNGYGDNG